MKIKLTHKTKISLLEAINSGYIDTSIFDNKTSEQEITIEDIEREIVRLEKAEGGQYLLALSDLMRRFASNEITEEVYISERIKLSKNN